MGENRFILEDMNPTFDWLSVDKDRNMLMSHAPEDHTIHAKEQSIYTTGIYKNSVEHKYSYNALMYKLQAWGWSSTKDHIGVYFINPSNEYIGGGPEKLDLIDHCPLPARRPTRDHPRLLDLRPLRRRRDNTKSPPGRSGSRSSAPSSSTSTALADPKDPTQAELDKLKATSGSGMPAVPAEWHDNALALWNDAVAKVERGEGRVALSWVEGMDYPHKEERGTVTGQLVLDDPQAASKTASQSECWPDSRRTSRGPRSGYTLRAGNGDIVTWPHDGELLPVLDAKALRTADSPSPTSAPAPIRCAPLPTECWANTPRPHSYRGSGQDLDLGKLDWQPVRYGKQIWEIGYPDRTGDKFFKGDGANYWLWGWGLRYSRPLPQRHHLHHRQERLPQGLVLPGGAALHHHRLAESRGQGPLQPALRLGGHPADQRRPVAAVGQGPGHHLDGEIQHAQGPEGHGRILRMRWPERTAAIGTRYASVAGNL